MHTQNAPGWIWSPLPGSVRWSTVATGAVLFATVLWQTRRPVGAVAVTMAWLCGFEILYQATGAVVHRWSLGTLTLTVAGTGGWLLLAYLLGVRPNRALTVVVVAVWIIWIALGFESNMPDRIIPGAATVWSWRDELLNVGTKTLLALALLTAAPSMRVAEPPGLGG
jgi:hypothetical protein